MSTVVMPALVAGIHVFRILFASKVDGRDKPGHDVDRSGAIQMISRRHFVASSLLTAVAGPAFARFYRTPPAVVARAIAIMGRK